MISIDEAKLDQVYQKVLRLEEGAAAEAEAYRQVDRDHRRKLRKQRLEREVLREKRRPELMQAAGSIFEWLTHFAENPKGRTILSLCGEIEIFTASYDHCEPADWEGYIASLTYDSKGLLHYREICGRPKVLANPEQMVRQLHPDYILAVLDEITSGRVWEKMELPV